MAKREDIANGGEGVPAQPTDNQAKNQPDSVLPLFDAPPLSPGGETPASDVEAPAIEVIAMPEPPRFRMTPRQRRYAVLAASVVLAAGLGGVIGAAASGGFTRAAPADVAGLQERKAMQQTIARLGKEITALKTSIAAANKPGHSQVTKTSDKIIDKPIDKPVVAAKPAEQPEQPASVEVTGSVPTPRPAPRDGAVESAPPAHPVLAKGWSIRDVRDGYVYVQGRGDIYQVVPGAPLPGLGPVQSIKRQDGRWVVTTPKGIIVAVRDRQFFE